MRALWMLAALPLVACTPKYGKGVPKDVVKKLPYESRIELLEAENALAVAVDKVDEAQSEVLRARDAIRRAKSRLDSARDEEAKAKDEISREVARLALTEAGARLEYLRARQELNVQAKELEDLAFRCAYARFEISQLEVAQRAKVAGSEKLDPKEFEKQAKDCDAEVAQRRKMMEPAAKRADAAKTAWDGKREALAKKTFDARASPYVE